MRIDSTSFSFERYQMLRVQTRRKYGFPEIFVASDDDVATNPRVQAQAETNLTHSEGIGGPSTAPSTDSLDM